MRSELPVTPCLHGTVCARAPVDSVTRNTNELVDLVTKSRTVLSSFAKAKTAKLGKYMHQPDCQPDCVFIAPQT